MWAGELLAGIDFGKRIRRNFGVRRCLAGRTRRMSLGLRACREVVVLVGLVIASIVPFAKGKALPSQPSTAQEGEAAASAPTRPVAAEQKATKPAKVTYVDGQLTIIAENSLLSDILSALHTAMGAEIDLPASASNERIWVRLGPGPARKVVSELLSGTDLNFVIQGSATDAEGIQSVLLTPHSEAGPGNPGISSGPQERVANRRPLGGNPTVVEAPQPENPVPAETTTASSDPTLPDAGSPRPAPQSEAASVSSAAENTMAHPSPPSSITSEEIKQQLLSMYQQRRQLQQIQPSPPANPNP